MNEPIKDKVFEYIKSNSAVTYAELEHLFEQIGFDYSGDIYICSDINESVVFWAGWSADAFAVLSELIKSGKIKREPCSSFIYLLDGKTLSLPLVKKNIVYKQPHWLPSVFVPTENHRKPYKAE